MSTNENTDEIEGNTTILISKLNRIAIEELNDLYWNNLSSEDKVRLRRLKGKIIRDKDTKEEKLTNDTVLEFMIKDIKTVYQL